jgi:glycosyltransferase involved in cell wall biosynthesis
MSGIRPDLRRVQPTRHGRPKLVGVLLCYNDGDFIADAVRHLLENGHDVIAWDHGSSDETADELRRLRNDLVEVRTIPRSFDFYKIYPEMSKNLIDNYVDRYEWISWPDQDEILEGPDRSRRYEDWLEEVVESPYDWLQFRNFNFWWTPQDDPSVTSAVDRVRHYSLFSDCGPRIRSWRSTSTNERHFNHNPPSGERYPTLFNLRHYPMRSEAQMKRRLDRDRVGLQRDGSNFHYDNMRAWQSRLTIPASSLNYDDGAELDTSVRFDWRTIYGDEDSASRLGQMDTRVVPGVSSVREGVQVRTGAQAQRPPAGDSHPG